MQRVRTLDHAIETLGKRPVRKLDPPVRAALRLGAYQLGYTDTAPHAAANESVELVRRARLERAVPFTNAVMRRLAEGIHPLLDALPDGALKESYPDWISRRGCASSARTTRSRSCAPATSRSRRSSGSSAAILRASRPTSPAPTASSASTTLRSPKDGSGRRAAARSSSALVVGSQDGERVLDLCAAPGGKTTQLRGEATAVEIDSHRASELRANVAQVGATNVTVVEADGTQLPPELDGFDRALVDAPCSGLGVLSQRPDLRWRAEPLPELQLALLRSAAERVRPGGTIVYSVCTINAAESEEVVAASGLRVLPLGEEWPAFAHPRRPEFLQTLPHVHGTSGFFISRLEV